MSTLPVGLQILVWAYFLVASAALTGCVALLCAGLARGRHRRRADPLAVVHKLWTDLVDGFANGAEWLIYGGRA